jgi:hypothetical protein
MDALLLLLRIVFLNDPGTELQLTSVIAPTSLVPPATSVGNWIRDPANRLDRALDTPQFLLRQTIVLLFDSRPHAKIPRTTRVNT